jgi:hypothetical protein
LESSRVPSTDIGILLQRSCTPGHTFPWKHRSFRNFHEAQRVAAQTRLTTALFLLINHQRATDSKSDPTQTPTNDWPQKF